MPDRQKKSFSGDVLGQKQELYHQANEDAIEGEKSFRAFTDKHGTLDELAKAVAKDADYQKELKPVFDSVLGMVQIATGGDPNQVRALFSSPNQFFEKLIQDDNGLLRGFLMARAMHEVASRPSRRDPLEWGKFLLEIMAMSRSSVVIPERVEGEVVPGGRSSTATVVDQFLPKLEKAR